MSFTVRRVYPCDEAVFDRIAAGVFDDPIDPLRLHDYLRAPGHHMVVAVENGEIVGMCAAVLHRHPDKATELYVDEVGTGDDHRRRGIATAMMREMFAWGRELGCSESWLGTELDNVEANALYGKAGGKREHMVYYEFRLSGD